MNAIAIEISRERNLRLVNTGDCGDDGNAKSAGPVTEKHYEYRFRRSVPSVKQNVKLAVTIEIAFGQETRDSSSAQCEHLLGDELTL